MPARWFRSSPATWQPLRFNTRNRDMFFKRTRPAPVTRVCSSESVSRFFKPVDVRKVAVRHTAAAEVEYLQALESAQMGQSRTLHACALDSEGFEIDQLGDMGQAGIGQRQIMHVQSKQRRALA